MKYQLGSVTRIGNRKENEDSYGSFTNGHALVMVVADGMGGHQCGKLASQTVVNCAEQLFAKERSMIKDPVGFLQRVVLLSHDKINAVGASQDPPIDPRTTAVICLVQGGYAWWAHIGDSRLYHFRDRKLHFRTRDHSRIEELMQQGLVTAKEALTHPFRHQITRCVGGPEPITQITLTQEVPLEQGDTLLMCSDGLWNALGSKRILSLLGDDQVDELASNLASEAESLATPRSDNITVMVMKWQDSTRTYLLSKEWGEASEPTEGAAECADNNEHKDASKDDVDKAVDTLKSIFDEYENELKE